MNRFVLLIALLWAALPAHATGERPPAPADRAAALRAALLDASTPGVFVAAHRADWRQFPENSLPAIRSALQLGVDIIEIDVGRTKDGAFVILHDETLDRTTTGTGRVADHTLEEIRALRLRNGCGVPTETPVPAVEEALLAVKGRALVNLDKSYAWLREFFPILERTGTTGQVIVKTYDLPAAEVLAENGDLLRRVIYMPIVNFKLPGAADRAREHLAKTQPPLMEIAYPHWREDVGAAFTGCAAAHVRIWGNSMWTGLSDTISDDRALDQPEENYGRLLARGVTVIQTDRPADLLAYLRQRGAHP